MYSTKPGLILAFHGCDRSVVEKVINGKESLKDSENEYDWLGHGVYFWENSPSRALEYAIYLKNNPQKSRHPIKYPAVIGAVISLGLCLDLLDFVNLQLLRKGYEVLIISNTSTEFPQNEITRDSKELLLRNLDCAVIETLHTIGDNEGKQPFDSVRGVFWEGKELYPNAGFREKDHIQICIKNPNCIKGYFLPRILNKKYPKI